MARDDKTRRKKSRQPVFFRYPFLPAELSGKRNLQTELNEILLGLSQVWDDTFPTGGANLSPFIERIYGPMLMDEQLDAKKMLDDWLGSEVHNEREKQIEQLVITVSALCATAYRLNRQRRKAMAQSYAMTAAKWFGCVRMYWAMTREPGDRSSREIAKLAAMARHLPGRENKAKLQAWYTANSSRFRSMDKAAEEAAPLFDVAFRTARKYIGEVGGRKKLPSARKV